jgi:hypothetical protein
MLQCIDRAFGDADAGRGSAMREMVVRLNVNSM